MNTENFQKALSYFQLSDDFSESDFQESVDELLHEIKTFFAHRVFIEKIAKSRLLKLDQMMLHAQELSFYFEKIELKIPILEGGTIFTVFNSYQKLKLNLKLGLSSSVQPVELKAHLLSLINLEKEYAKFWFSKDCIDESTLISKETDEIELLQAIIAFQDNGFSKFKDLQNSENNPPQILVNEMKRLSLLFQKY